MRRSRLMCDTAFRRPGEFAWLESVTKDRQVQSELHQAKNVRMRRSDAVRVAAQDIVKPARALCVAGDTRAPQSVIAARGSRDGKCRPILQPRHRHTGLNS